jgi:phosphatidate phosphatase APP1
VLDYLKDLVIDADDHLDAARRRLDRRFGLNLPRHIAAYRGHASDAGVEVSGRVLAEPPLRESRADADWWDNLLDTYRRFESDEVPGVEVNIDFRGQRASVTTDHEGYYHAVLPAGGDAPTVLWENATVSLGDGSLATPQPVMRVMEESRIGIISDIDDTVLHSGITNWRTAAQLTFLHNARTRKPLAGVAALYHALQVGTATRPVNPLFYVSSSPWNLYELLEDFMELNGIPDGPIFLRDLGTDEGKFLKSKGHGHKLERARTLIKQFPRLRWVLLGDSGQADAELYAEAAREFGDRIAAIYIRDVDPGADSVLDRAVDGHIQSVSATRVPMLRAADSEAMARHAATLGLIRPEAVAQVALDVAHDRQRPTPFEAAVQGPA